MTEWEEEYDWEYNYYEDDWDAFKKSWDYRFLNWGENDEDPINWLDQELEKWNEI